MKKLASMWWNEPILVHKTRNTFAQKSREANRVSSDNKLYKPKGKKTMKAKKTYGSRHSGVGTQLHPNFFQQKSAEPDHWAMRPLRR